MARTEMLCEATIEKLISLECQNGPVNGMAFEMGTHYPVPYNELPIG